MEEKSNTGSVARLEDNGAVASGDSDTAERIVVTDPLGRYQRTNVLLGRGAYKEVFKAYDQEEGREVAWNQMLVDHLAPADIQQILSEITLLASLRNENIINLFHAWSSPGLPDGRLRVFFITELMSSGTLKAYMKRTGTVSIKPKVLKNWCKQILKGLDYLHSHAPPIIHRDLKCDNIFINGNHGVAKIGDLGMATIKEKEHMSHVIGTPEFMAPELYDEKYDEKVDIYAFGMCVLEMATKEYPYSECTNAAQIFRKVTTGIKPSNLTKVQDHDILTLIEQCIEADPIKRPTAKQLLALPLLITENNSSFGPSSSSNNVGTSAASSAGSNSSNVILNGATKSPSLKPSNVTIVSSQANPVATFSTSSNVSSSHPKSIESSSSNMTASTSNWSVGADDILPPNLIGLNAGLQQQRPSSPLRNTNQSITQMNSGSSITEDSTDVTHNDTNTSNSKYGRETSLKRSSSLPARLQVAASPLGSSRTLADVTSPVAEDSEESEQVTQDTGINDRSRQDVIYDNRIQMLKNQNDQSVQRQLAENPGGYLSSQLSQLMMMNTRPGSAPPVSSEDTPTHGGGTPTSSTDNNNNNNTNRNLDKVNGNGNEITTIASSSPGSKGVQLVIRDNHIHYSPMMNGSGVSSSRKEHQVASGSSNRSDPASFLDQNRRFCDIEIIPDSDTQRTRQVTMKMTYFANNLAGNTPEGKNAHEIRFPYNLELDTPLLVALEMIREKILPEAELNMAEEKIKSAVDLAMTVLFGNDHPVGVGLMSPPRLTSRTSGIGSGTNVLHEKDGKEGNSATTEVVTNPSLLNDMGKSPDGIAGEVGHLVISSGGSDDIFRRRSLQLSSDKKQLEPSSKTLLDSSKVIINDGNNIGGGGVGASSFSGNSNGSNSNGGSTKDSHKLSPRVSRSKSINNSQPGNRRQHRKSSSHVSPSIFDQKQSREPSLLAPNTFTAYTGTPSPLSRNRQPSFGGGGIGSPGSPLANNASALTNNNPIVLHFYRPSRESSSSTNGGVVGVDDKTGPSAIRKGRAYSNENLKSSPIVGTGPGPGNYARGRTPIKASLVKNHRRSKSSFSLPPAFPHNFYGKMSSSLVKSPEAIIDIVPETVGTDNGNGPMKDDPRGGLEADKNVIIDVGEVKGRVGVGGGNIDGSESDKNDRALYHSDISEAMEEEDEKGVVKDGYEIDTMSEDIDDDDDEEEDDDGDDEEDEDDGFLAGDDSSFSTSNNTPQRSTKKSSKHLKRKSRSVVSGPGKQRIHSDSRSRDKKRVFDRKSNLNRNLNRSSSRSNNDHDDGDPKVQGDRNESNVNVNRVESGDRKISGSSGDADHELSSNNQDQVTTTTMVKKPTSQTNENGQVVIHKSNIAGKSDMHSHEEDVGNGKLRHEAPQPISVSSLRNSHHSPSNSIFPDSSNEPRPPPCLKTATPALLEQESSEKQVSGDVDEKLLEEEKHPEMVALRKQFELRMRSLTQEFEREKQQLLFKLEANSIKTITNSNNALNNNSNTNTQPIGQSKSPSLNTTTTTRRSINDGNLNLALSIGAVASPTSSVSAASDLERQLSELQSKALLSFESEIKSSHTGSTGSSIITATSISGTSNQNIMNQNNHLRSVSVGAISVSVGGAKSLFTSQQVNENSVNPAGDDDGNGDDNGDDNGGHNGDDNGDDNDDHLTTFTNTNTRPSTTPPTS